MKCDFNYCIYSKKCACILDEIQIDSFGMCETCEMVAIPKNSLEEYKKIRLKEIKELWKNYNK